MSSAKKQLFKYLRDVLVPAADEAVPGAVSRDLGGVLMDVIEENVETNEIYEETFEAMDVNYPETIDLTLNSTRSLQANATNTLGTLKPDAIRPYTLLHVNTTQVEFNEDILPSSNRSGSLVSSKVDLLSARSTISSSGSTTTGSNKFGVFVLPDDNSRFDEICKRKIGNGAKMCIRKNCAIYHKGGNLASVIRGDIFVQKSSEVLFLEPRTHDTNVTKDVLKQWTDSRRKIDEWVLAFALANSTTYHEVLTRDDLMQGMAYVAHAKEHKSPGTMVARRFEKSNDTYSKFFDFESVGIDGGEVSLGARKRSNSDEELDENGAAKASRRKYSDDYSNAGDTDGNMKADRLKIAIEEIYGLFKMLAEKLDEKDTVYSEEVKILFSRLDMFDTDMGTRSTCRTDNLEVPTLWGSVAVLAGAIDEVQRDIEMFPSTTDLKKSLLLEFDRIENNAFATVKIIQTDLEERVTKILSQIDFDTKGFTTQLQSFATDIKDSQDSNDDIFMQLAQGAFQMKNEIGALRQQVRAGSLKPNGVTSSSSNCKNYVPISNYDADMILLEGELKNIRGNISKLVSDIDGEAIKSFGLGFRDRRSSDAWVDENLVDETFGLVVDVHLVMEHIFYNVSEEEGTLKTLSNIRKLELLNLTQARCITSFETRVPKILSKSSLVVASQTRGGISHFDRVPTFAAWDENQCGIKDVIKDQLGSFEVSHQEEINSNTEEDSRGRAVATQALQTSVLWITQFINYIDDTYKGFMRQHTFTTEKAWELVTQLGRRIFLEVSAPRVGISTSISVGKNNPILLMHKMVLWPTLRSHDIMKAFKEASYRDHPTIAGEYVKFLTANSGGEVIDKLVLKINSMKEDIVKATKAAHSASNAVDEMKRKIIELERRMPKKN